MSRLLALILSSLVPTFLWPQASLHLDKPYYFAGDFIFFSFCSADLGSDTVTVEASLYQAGGWVCSELVQAVGGCGDGHLKLPFETQSAHCQIQLTAFDRKDLTRRPMIGRDLFVYNDDELDALAQLAQSAATGQAVPPALLAMQGAMSAAEDELTVRVEVPAEYRAQLRRVSVAVRDQALFSPDLPTATEDLTREPGLELAAGVPVHGTRQVLSGGSIASTLLFALNPDQMRFDGTEVDRETGHFALELSPFYGSRTVTFLDYLDRAITVEASTIPSPSVETKPLWVDSLIMRHLEIHREVKQINRIFKQTALEVAPRSSPDVSVPVEANYFFDVQDYDLRGTLVQFFKELITPLKFRSAGGGRQEAKMFYERNGITKNYGTSPLFLVNNRATRQSQGVASLPLQEIATCEIYSLYETLEAMAPVAFGGIVNLQMVDRNYALPEEEVLPALQIEGLQQRPSYPIKPMVETGAPSVGSLAYWNPALITDGQSLAVTFGANDVTHVYLVEVVLHLNGPQPIVVLQQVVSLP